MTVKGFAATDTLQTFLKAHELCERLGDDAQLFRVLFGLAIVLLVRGEYEKGRQFAEDCLRLAERREDTAMMVQAHWALGLSLKYLGEFTSAHEHFGRTLALYDPERHAAHAFLYGGLLNHAHLGSLLSYLGYADQAKSITNKALAIAEKVRHPIGLCNALSIAIAIEAFQHNAERVIEMAEEMIFQAEEHGLPFYKAIGTIMRGWARAMRGDVQQSLAEMRQGLDAHRDFEAEQQRASYLVLMAEALSIAGRVDEGLRALDEAVEGISNTAEHFYEAELYRVKADLLMRREGSARGGSRESEIEACLGKAIEIARRQAAKAFELRAALSLARLRREQGRIAEARQMLSGIYGWFTEGFDTEDLKEARSLLDQLHQQAATP
jgi:predicted ATPase